MHCPADNHEHATERHADKDPDPHAVLPGGTEHKWHAGQYQSHGGYRQEYFCPECGTQLVCTLEEYPEYTYITICSLDEPQDFEPKGDMYTDDQLPWVKG